MATKKKKKSIKPTNIPILFFDGASRGNPGKAAGAAVILMADGKRHTVSKFIDFGTNNEAEYTALIIGLQKAKKLGIKELQVKGDSNLVVNQVNGFWKIKSDRLWALCNKARSLIGSFENITLDWISREQNKLADEAANKCIDKARGIKHKPAVEIPAGVKPAVGRILKLASKARFKDYMNLKSGRDEFTSKRLPGLKKLVPEEVQLQIAQEWDGNDIYLAKVYRWYLRGLPPDMAIRKVRTDAEVEENATGRHPWKDQPEPKSKPTPPPCHYALGDVVAIANSQHPKYQMQGVVAEAPQLLNSGKWLLTVEVEGIPYPLKLKESDISDLSIDYFSK
ncbi:MAG: ribonuclease HI family protein [Xenococcaceae cyanobacterium]